MSKPKMSVRSYPLNLGITLRSLQRYVGGLGLWLVATASTCLAEQVDALKNGTYGALDEIVFATRSQANDGHWYANFSYWSVPYKKINYGKDGRLCCWNIKTGQLRLLVDDTEGAVRDPCVSYDAKKNHFFSIARAVKTTSIFLKSTLTAKT